MDLEATRAYIATVGADRTVALPSEIPPGAMVAIVLLTSPASGTNEEARRQRFAATHQAIRAASEWTPSEPPIDDAALAALVDDARRA